jgi:tetratricopeptide (TPR) repeat protein
MNWFKYGLIGIIFAATAAAQTVQEGLELNDRGNAARDRNDIAAAKSLFRQSAGVFRALGPKYEAHLAGALMNLGMATAVEGDRIEASHFYEQALELHRRTLGTKHIRTLTNMNYLGSAYMMLGDLDRAEALFAEVLPIARQLYPKDMELASALAGLSAVRARQKRFEEALALGDEAMALCTELQGDDSIDTALTYADIAEIHRMAGRDARALPLYRKARAIYEKALGPEHVRVASILSQEGLILMNDNKLALANAAMTRAVDVLASSCPKCLIERWIAESNLGLLRLKQGRFDEAAQLFSNALAMEEKSSPTPSREMAQTLYSLAAVREKQRRHEEALRLNQRADLILSYR